MFYASIRAIEYALPRQSLTNEDLARKFPEWSPEKIEAKLGIRTRRIASSGECSSDLAVAAALKLFASGACNACDIDFVLFCTQTPDYLIPTSACIIQHRLGVPTSAGAIDFNLGCSGFVYGIGLAKALIETGQASNVLLLTGETYSKLLDDGDKTTRTLFGDAGTATLVSVAHDDAELLGPFIYGTDGAGHGDLIVRNSGMRILEGANVDRCSLMMNGAEIYSFSLREVSSAVEQLMQKSNTCIEEIDLFVFHQANAHMLEFLRRKCSIPKDKFYVHFSETGNTVSNTIPIALHNAIADKRISRGSKVMLVGFGVGYSWAACLATFE